MKETGQIVAIDGNDALVLFNRTTACGKCGACGMTKEQQTVTVKAQNTLNAQVGEKVELEFASKNAFKSSLIAYIFPLFMLFLGIFIGYSVEQDMFEARDVMAAILGIAFALGSFIVLRILDPVFQRKFKNVYTMVRINSEDG